MIAIIAAKPRPKAMTGESTIGITTLLTTTSHFAVAPAASAAPTRPPIKAWEDEEGRP